MDLHVNVQLVAVDVACKVCRAYVPQVPPCAVGLVAVSHRRPVVALLHVTINGARGTWQPAE